MTVPQPTHKAEFLVACTAFMSDEFLSELLHGIYETEDYGSRSLALIRTLDGHADVLEASTPPIKGFQSPLLGQSLVSVYHTVVEKCKNVPAGHRLAAELFMVLDDRTLADKTVCLVAVDSDTVDSLRVDYPIAQNALAAWSIGCGSFRECKDSLGQVDPVQRYDWTQAAALRSPRKGNAPRKMLAAVSHERAVELAQQNDK